jgi:ATP-binding cassette subfamily C protein LapB
VAIVGRVGSGKTTIGKLTAKLFEPEKGSIYIGGVDILQLDPAEVRENIGYVSQEPWLIAGTIEQNITLGASEVSTEDVIWASTLSGASDFIDQHPKGYKLHVRERGEGISGGQKQCITIARALVRRPKILIFDEPTSSMDARTEKTFIDSFRQQKLESTLILITHRTSLLSLVDRVIVIDNGKIVGAGPTAAFLGAKIKPGEPQKADISALDK